MKTLLFVLTLTFTATLTAQLGIHKKRLEEAKLIKDLSLLVVLNDSEKSSNKEMNVMLKEAVGKYWTYSKHIKFINKKELRAIAKDKSNKGKYAYLMFSEKLYQANVPKGVFCIGLLDKKTFTHFKKFEASDDDLTPADYKLGLFWLQKDLTFPQVGLKKSKERQAGLARKFKKKMPTSTLLIDESLIADDLKKDIGKLYKHNYKIVSKDVIDEAIINQTPNTLYLKALDILSRPVASTKKPFKEHTTRGTTFNCIYNAEDNSILLMIPPHTKSKHFEKIMNYLQ